MKRNQEILTHIKEVGLFEQMTLKPFTIVKLTYVDKKSIGMSRCSELDKWNEDEGIKKAKGLAIKAMMCKVEHKSFPQLYKKYMG